MRRLVLAGAVVAALALSGCQDGFKPVDLPGDSEVQSFALWDKDANSLDYGMAIRACGSIGQDVDEVLDVDEDGAGIVTCQPEGEDAPG